MLRWTGLEHEELQYQRSPDRLLEFPPGTLMNEIETTWRWPRVVGKVDHDRRNPLEYAKLWRIAQARAGKPVKFGTCSSQVLSIFLDNHTGESRANSIETYLERLKGDVWTVEMSANEFAEIDLFKPYAGSLKEEGRGRRREPPHAAGRHATDRRRAGPARDGGDPGGSADPVQRLRIRSTGSSRTIAFYKATAIAQARNIVLRELGLEERYLPAADPALQVDVLPDREPLTHLPSPWT